MKKLIKILSWLPIALAIITSFACSSSAGPTDEERLMQNIRSVYNSYVVHAEENNEPVKTYEEWLNTIRGEDGRTPVITISADGYWEIDGVKTDYFAKGDTGKSAFDIYKEYHPDYNGTEEEWVESLKGDVGETGKSVKSAYINENTHLILVMSDNSEIDAGYVGVDVPRKYDVDFYDYDNTLLKREQVYANESAAAPTVSARKGYRFVEWNKDYSTVISNMDVKAVYATERNQLYFDYEEDEAYLTVTLGVYGNVNLYGLEFKIEVNAVGLTYQDTSDIAEGSAVNYENGEFIYSFVANTGKNVKAEFTLLTIKFVKSGENYDLTFNVKDVDIFDEDFNNETFVVANNSKVK